MAHRIWRKLTLWMLPFIVASVAWAATSARDPGTLVAVTTTASTVIASNTGRKAWCVIAHTDNFHNVYLRFGSGATSSNILLRAKDSWCERAQYGYEIYTGPISVVTTYGGANIYSVEY